MRILYLDLDALNPSHLGCYGYPRNTSPTIDRIASEGVRFDNFYTSDAPCLPSRTAFYSGRFGIQTGVVGHGGTAADPKPQGIDRDFTDVFVKQGLAHQLQLAGFHTAMVSPFGQRHAAHHFYAGFNEIHNTGKLGNEVAYEVTPTVMKWLGDHAGDDNWYLHVNYWDIHTPYRTPMEFGEPVSDEPLPAWYTPELLTEHMKHTGPHGAMEPGMYGPWAATDKFPRTVDQIDTFDKLKHWLNGYDNAIRYVDDQIKMIVDHLMAAGVYDETAIIVSADHGENQGQLGLYGEHATADHATCNIPCIIKWPGIEGGRVDDGLHYQIDTAPTLMDLLNRDKPELWDGRSYAASLTDAADTGREHLVLSQCCHVCQRSVRWDRYLYIHTYHDGWHLFPREMVFDLEADPYEEHDLADERPDLCREGAYRLQHWHHDQMAKMARVCTDVVDPLWTVMKEGGPQHANIRPGRQIHRYVRRLEQTGRADGAEALRAKYPQLRDA